MIREFIYDASLVIVIATAAGAVAHPRVHTGIVGGLALLALSAFTLAAFDYEVSNWRLGQVVAGATLCVWLIARFWWQRAKMRRRLLQVICERCPLHRE